MVVHDASNRMVAPPVLYPRVSKDARFVTDASNCNRGRRQLRSRSDAGTAEGGRIRDRRIPVGRRIPAIQEAERRGLPDYGPAVGGMSGLELQKHLAGLGSRIPIIVISAFSDERERALIAGAIDFLGKPVTKEDLLRCIRVALER